MILNIAKWLKSSLYRCTLIVVWKPGKKILKWMTCCLQFLKIKPIKCSISQSWNYCLHEWFSVVSRFELMINLKWWVILTCVFDCFRPFLLNGLYSGIISHHFTQRFLWLDVFFYDIMTLVVCFTVVLSDWMCVLMTSCFTVGLSDWMDEDDIMAQVIAESQKEYLDSLKKSAAAPSSSTPLPIPDPTAHS